MSRIVHYSKKKKKKRYLSIKTKNGNELKKEKKLTLKNV